MSKKRIIYIVFIGSISFSLFFLVYFGVIPLIPSSTYGDKSNNGVENITLIIDYSGVRDLKIRENFSLQKGDTSVFHALLKWCDVRYKTYSGGAIFIEGIDGVINNINLSNYYWLYYVNGEFAPVGASGYFLNNGDLINWNYSSYN